MIKEISLKNFRKFTNSKFQITSKNVIISGLNATGKTTILEALLFTSITKSHRTKNRRELIQKDKDYAEVKVLDDNDIFRLILTKDAKAILKNKIEVKKMSDYIGDFPIIFFSPYEMQLITGSPINRRNFLNREIGQFNKNYIKLVNSYNDVLNERNVALKQEKVNREYLSVLTDQLVDMAKKIIESRQNFIKCINLMINNVHHKLNNDEKISITYKPSLALNELKEGFANHLEQDIRAGQTELGPQRDDLVFNLNGEDISKFGSQGQIRSMILSIKITLCYLFNQRKNKFPLLLLDDVLSELDEERINNLLNVISDLGQVIITTVNIEKINQDILKKYQIINL